MANPAADLNVLSLFLFNYLNYQLLIGQKSFPGLPEQLEMFLQELASGIKLLEPERSADSVNEWVAEMYRIVVKIPALTEMRKAYLDWTTDIFLNLMVSLLPPEKLADMRIQQFLQRFAEVVRKAAELAVHISTSTKDYRLIADFAIGDGESDRIMLITDLKKYTVVDAATGQLLRPASAPEADAGGRIGVKVCVIYPALCRTSSDGNTQLTLVKATILVKFDQAVPKGGKPKAASRHDSDEVLAANTAHGKSFI